MHPSINHVVNKDGLNCCYVKKNQQTQNVYKLSLFSYSPMMNTHSERLSRKLPDIYMKCYASQYSDYDCYIMKIKLHLFKPFLFLIWHHVNLMGNSVLSDADVWLLGRGHTGASAPPIDTWGKLQSHIRPFFFKGRETVVFTIGPEMNNLYNVREANFVSLIVACDWLLFARKQ